MSGRSALLVVAHEATRTGSPAVLLRLLREVAPTSGLPLSVRLLADGPLAPELRALSSVDPVTAEPAAVLVNSALAVTELAPLDPDLPVAVYVHEQGEALASLDPAARQLLRERPRRVLAASAATASDLVELDVDPARIEVLAPVVDPPAPGPGSVAAVRARLGPGPLLMGCGVAEWRKGADLFVELAAALADRPGLRFAWVGSRGRAMARRLDADVRGAGVEGRVEWVGEVDDPAPWLAAADAVVMCSREDPQPLVPVEAALVGTPSAAFEVGGLAAMAAEGAVRGTAYPDVVALARACDELLGSPELRERTVGAGRAWWAAHHAPAVVLPRFRAVLQDLLP